MPLRKKELELSVERPLGSSLDPRSEVVRLTARFAVEGEGAGPTVEELEAALHALREELGRIPGMASGPDRPLEELVQAYRPRQVELVDLLRAEGEISPGEHEVLRTYVATTASPPGGAHPAPVVPPSSLSPTQGVPRGAAPRPVGTLLAEYRIQSLREAGLVRARRQISFEEYMALKRHFAARTEGRSAPDSPAPTA